MRKTHERIALSVGALAAFGILYNVVFEFMSSPNGISTKEIFYISFLAIVGVACLLCLIPRFEKMKFIHPLAVFALATIAILQDPSRSDGYLYFILFFFLGYEYEYLKKRFFVRAGAAIVYLCGISAYSMVINQVPIRKSMSVLIVTIGFIYFLWQLTRSHLTKYSRPVLNLDEYEISEVDAIIIRSFAVGKAPKEIALEQGISDRTVYRHLGVIQGKFGVEDLYGLQRFLAEYRVE